MHLAKSPKPLSLFETRGIVLPVETWQSDISEKVIVRLISQHSLLSLSARHRTRGKGGSFGFGALPGESPVQMSAFRSPLISNASRTHYRAQLFFHICFSPSIPGNLHGGAIKLGLFLSQQNALVPPNASRTQPFVEHAPHIFWKWNKKEMVSVVTLRSNEGLPARLMSR